MNNINLKGSEGGFDGNKLFVNSTIYLNLEDHI